MKLSKDDIHLLMAALEKRVDNGDKKAEELYVRLHAELKGWRLDDGNLPEECKQDD